MQDYIKTLQRASGEVYTVFKQAAATGKNPDRAYKELEDKYKGSVAEEYVSEYCKICKEELPGIKEPQSYFAEAQKATAESWKVFKAHVGKLYQGEMTERDWNLLIKDATEVGYKRWDLAVKEYAKRYSALCVWELDRQYQRLHHIKKDWYKFV